MPKIKSTLKSKISNWIAPYNENKEIFSSDGKVICCLEKKHISKLIPDESNLRKNYISSIYKNVNDQIISDNLNSSFTNVIESLTDDAASVEKLKQVVQNNAVKCGLVFIKLHLSELSVNLENLEESNSELLKSMYIFRKIKNILTNIPGPNGKKIKEKCMYVIKVLL
ncbi:Hypothetical protein CINCED_3A018397 [Cinara cedri]|uniref:Uncharacterized protein n=1 Tax=Cinara cedri TaxID=506608 RepID=A0A5E4NPQ5_9HEMI|nr:Hypothetical protein CINCED_3A018397 [Cinara cedri]